MQHHKLMFFHCSSATRGHCQSTITGCKLGKVSKFTLSVKVLKASHLLMTWIFRVRQEIYTSLFTVTVESAEW